MSGPAVVGLATETDLERLRQMALLLEAENARLHRRLVDLTRALAAATGATHTQLELEIARLQEQLAARTRALFGRSSERRGGAEREETTSPPAPRRGHGPRSQPELPRVDVVHTAAAPVAPCAQCGGALEPWTEQYEDAEEIDVVERSFRLVRHRRQKYRCQCGGGVVTAPGPAKLIPGGRYSVDFAVGVAVAKYLDHLPLARQVRQMARAGLTVDTQTLWDQLLALSQHLAPTYEALVGDVLAAAAVVLRERRARAAPIVERIRTWVTQQRALPQSALGKALAYTTELWPGLVAFLYQAAIPVDNNATERALRGIALGRKNHYGSRSERGTRVAALCYTLLESAKLAGVEPAAYLAAATRRAIATPGMVTRPRDLRGT